MSFVLTYPSLALIEFDEEFCDIARVFLEIVFGVPTKTAGFDCFLFITVLFV